MDVDRYPTEVDEGEKAVRLSQVAAASERLDAALERLGKQASMLEDRLGNYLRKTDEAAPGEGIREDPAVPAAANLERAARFVEGVADSLGELRNRFEG